VARGAAVAGYDERACAAVRGQAVGGLAAPGGAAPPRPCGPAALRARGAVPALRAGAGAARRGGGVMKAVVYFGYGVMPEVAEVAEPACPADGAVIAVGATGVCRSDWHAWRGHDPVALPHIGGHEFAGVVAAVGAEVSKRRAGDRVTVPF